MKTKTIPVDDPSRFHGDTELVTTVSGKRRMAGLYDLDNGFWAQYSVTEQIPTAKYILRGKVTLLDPSTGIPIYVKDWKKVNSEELSEEDADGANVTKPCSRKMTHSPAQHVIHLRETSPDVIRKAISDAAARLYHSNILQLIDSAEKGIPVGEMSFSLAVESFSEQYLAKKVRTKAARHTRLLRLRKVGACLGKKTISTISLNMVGQVRESIGGNWRIYIQEARDFLDFAYILKCDSELNNVFGTYLEKNPTEAKKSAKKLQRDAANSDSLSSSEEYKLRQEIMHHIDNGVYIGMALLLGTGLSAGEVCKFIWEDVQRLDLYADALYIHYRKDEVTGATHNYSFPVQGFCAEVLHKRQAWLREQGISDKKARQLTVASEKANPQMALDPKVLTEMSRNILHNFGVGYAQLASHTELKKGAGIAILQKTYSIRLEEHCHLDTDRALMEFLQHRSLTNLLQADHYRCFTDAKAIRMLVGSLRRDKRFTNTVTTKRAVRRNKEENGNELVTIIPPNSNYSTRCKGQVTLKPGEILEISAPYGCKVTAQLVPVQRTKKQLAENPGQEVLEEFQRPIKPIEDTK